MNDMFKNGGILNLFTQNIKEDENISLNKSAVADYSVLTTPNEGNRNPYSSGIFLSQIYLSPVKVMMTLTHKAEFVEWLICGNKASNRTNNASLSFEVVETISHPLQGGNSLLTKPNENIKMPTIKHPAVADFPQNLTPCDCTKQHEFLYETTINPINVGYYSQLEWGNIAQNIREKPYKSYEPEQKTILPVVAVIGYPVGVVAKSTTSRRKLNLHMANDSTPLTRAFFVRSLRTPKETQRIAIVQALRGSLSMVGRKGQRLGVGCVPYVAVFLPLYALPPTVGKLAVALKSTYGAITMLFKFLVLGDKRLTISIRAKSEQEARQKLQFTSPALCVARYNTSRSRTSKGGIYA